MSFWKCFSCLRFPNDENIAKLDYSNGTLTDVPPDVSQFERTLEELYLSSNRISDLPPELFYCQGIRVLTLNDNELESIPNAIGSLRQLQILDLSRNALTHIPENIKSCKHLTHLDLSLNNLQRLPDAITNLISLQELLLNETYLEFLPANFGRLVNLKILELRSNNLITLPKSMARLTDLVRIDIGANEFTELPEVIGQLTQLRELWIDYNRIRRISANISNLRELIHFEANSNQLTSLPNEISYWRNLEVLSLSTNDLESLPFSIGMLKNLITLKADSNQLKELPDSICHLENLEELIINHNYIMRLPSTIGLLRKLKFLTADENLLRRLPNELCSCVGLTVLSLRGNKITELPHDIGHLSNLRVLNIVSNAISYLPVSTLNLTNLTALWISDNQSQPLVPLQYSDSITKSQLTCFMLPQTSNPGMQSQQNDPRLSDYSDTSSWLHLQQMGRNYTQNPTMVTSPARRICFADESTIKPNDTITSRLMRSPTPYPKELRLMAKFAKTMNNTYRNSGSNTITEMVSQPTITDTQITSPSDSTLRIKEAKVLTNPGNGTKYLHNNPTNCDITEAQTNLIDTSEHYFYDTLKVINVNPNNYAESIHSNKASIKAGYDTYDGATPTSTASQYNCFNDLDMYNNWRDSIYDQQQHVNHRQPPPYHIAKAFTKKSREDLLDYDSMRVHQTEQHIDDNYNTTKYDTISLNNNNKSEQFDDAISNHSSSIPASMNGGSDQLNKSIERSPTKPSSQWLFGLHRNPTVKQVIVKKDHLLGFEIKEIPNQGIFVSTTLPNTSASTLLRADDKILDVDGVDFTKINIKEALQTLINSGPVLNIMISRK